MSEPIAELRKEYMLAGLRRSDLHPDPMTQFRSWFEKAVSAGVPEANAMTLATVDAYGQPSSRIVLLKGVDERGFSFFTNYESRKGRELAANPKAALTFFWPDLERQVCIRGSCSRLGVEESDAYFKIRPLGSRHSTWVSKQTEVIPGREWLEQKLIEIQRKYPSEVPLPPYWGGFVLNPIALEFWQGRPSRLHDRFRYERNAGNWKVDRLSP
ncbi:MAG: pyridoxamine 5-phosphate oxidase [Verrucomicrobiales bacterium]|jgi:pyridoxamine 5'-phosphate oxidase|nr:pyridoxamine 5-phosphate oxidase [Verrucomicrobiales bacterium]